MKKILLTTTFLVAGALGLLAQGKVNFDNMPFSFADSIENGGTVDYKIYKAGGMNLGNEVDSKLWKAGLFQAGTQVGALIPFFGTDFPGVWDTSSDPDAAFGGRTLSTAAGVATTLEVRIFDNTGAFVGGSVPFTYTPPTSPTPAPADLLMGNFRGFSVPEPSTVALGVLGLGALLLFRRRK